MRISDWSSDVCSSDLERLPSGLALGGAGVRRGVAAEIELREVDRAHHQRRKDAFPGVVGEDSAGEGEKMARHLDNHQTLAHLLADVRRDAHHSRIVQFNHEGRGLDDLRSEEHTSELQSLMRCSYTVFCLNKNNT